MGVKELCSQRTKDAKNTLLVFFLFLFIFLPAYSKVIFAGETFFRRDILRFYYPVWRFTTQSILHGTIPLWDPYNYCGSPFLANPQSCVFYPLTIFFYLPNYTWAFNFYILVHLSLAGFFTYLWAKDCEISQTSAFLSGVAYSLSGYMASTINLTISLCSAAYFPLAILTFRRALLHDGFFWKGVTAVVLLWQYLAGDPAISYGTIFIFCLFSLFKTIEFFFINKKILLKYLSAVMQILIVLFGLGAFQMLLFAEFLHYSQRLDLASFERTIWSVQYNDLLGVVIPFFSDISMYIMNYWERQSWLENYYSGGTVLIFSLAAWYFGGKKTLVGYHVLLALLGIALSLGQFSLIYPLCVRWVPMFHFIRYPVRFFFLFSFGVACLCGFGVDQVLSLLKRSSPKNRRRMYLWVFYLLILSAVAVYFVFDFESIRRGMELILQKKLGPIIKSDILMEALKDSSSAALANASRTIILMMLTLSGILTAKYLKPRQNFMVVFFSILIFADLFTANIYEPSLPKEIFDKPSTNLQVLLKDHSLFRILPSPKVAHMQVWGTGRPHGELQEDQKELLITNYIMLFGVQSLNGYNSIYLKDIEDIGMRLSKMKWPRPARLMNALNMKYMTSPNVALHYGFRLVNQTSFANLFKNTNALPRAFLVKKARVETDRKLLLDRLTANAFDAKQQVLIEKEPSVPDGSGASAAENLKDSVDFTEYSPNRVRMTVKVLNKPWLFFSDMYYPGWKALVDGHPAKIYRANYAFRSLYLLPGKHEVVWVYDPILLKIGLAITLFTLTGLFLYYLNYFKCAKILC